MAVLAIGSEKGNDGVLHELLYSASFPCNVDHLKQDLVTLKTNFSQFYSNEVFVDIFYDEKRFENVTNLKWNVTRFADKFTIAMKKRMTENLLHTYIKMDTSFGTSKFAISTFFDMKRLKEPPHNASFVIENENVAIFRIDRLKSRYFL